MAFPTTWTLLKAELADWLNRDDLTDQIPNFITYAESRLNRDLRVPEMEESASASASTQVVTLPSNFLQVRTIYLDTTTDVVLEPLPLGRLRSLYASGTTGTPQHYAIQSGAELVFGPPPSGSFTYVLNYYEKILALSGANADNWLLLAHPDLYLAAAMVEAMIFLRDAEGLVLWEGRTKQKIDELNKAGTKKQMGQSPLAPRIVGAQVSRYFRS